MSAVDADERPEPGDPVMVVTAKGERVPMWALSTVEPGQDFPIIWVCTEDEWAAYGTEADGLPWPARYVEASDG